MTDSSRSVNKLDNEYTAQLEDCYTLDYVPGHRIVKSLGLAECTLRNVAGNVPRKVETLFTDLTDTAKKLGANAVINARLTTGHYGKTSVSYVIAYGDAVLISAQQD